LKAADDSQILNFIQTFGLSIKNASKILKILDDIAGNEARREEIGKLLPKEKLKTLTGFIEAYKNNGAKFGEVFVEKFGVKEIGAYLLENLKCNF